jgi:predicted phage terminase large subunit-like protein
MNFSDYTLVDAVQALDKPVIPYCPHIPTPKQWELINSTTRETFYGGAWAGGKSDGQLMCALRYVDHSDYHALLLRRTYSDLSLPSAIMNRLHNWLAGTDAKWLAQDHTYLFPSGATVTFGYLENWRDRYRYRSSEVQYVGLDEGQQFSEEDALYTFSYLRKVEGSPIPLRWVLSANPGDIGHDWINKRYGLEGHDLNTRVVGDITIIRSQFEDNPYVDKSSLENLEKLDPVTFAQLRYGNWGINKSGGLFTRESFGIVEAPPNDNSFDSIVRFWDLAATAPERGKDPDYTSGLKLGKIDKFFYVLDLIHGKYDPATLDRILTSTAKLDGYGVRIREEQEGGASGVIVIDTHAKGIFAGYLFAGVRSSGSKLDRARPASAAASKGFIRLVRAPWNTEFLNELQVFPYGSHDDIVDSLSGAFNELNLNALTIPETLSSRGGVFSNLARPEKPPTRAGEPIKPRGSIWR